MNDLKHRRSLVAATGLSRQYGYRAEVAARLESGERADAIREHADFYARSVEAEIGARGILPLCVVSPSDTLSALRFPPPGLLL